MSLSSPFIRRPVATSLLMVAIVLLGASATSCCRWPRCRTYRFPTIPVTAQLPGADPQTMASTVATPLEKQFGQIPGLTQMTSSSATGTRRSHCNSRSNDDINRRRRTCRRRSMRRLASCRRRCRTRRSIRKTNPADTPVLMLALTSETLPLTTVGDYANSILAQKISQMPGVGLVAIGGEQNPAIRVQVNPAQLAASGPRPGGGANGAGQRDGRPAEGHLYGADQAYALQTNDQMLTPQEGQPTSSPIATAGRLGVRDVGRAIVGPQDETWRAGSTPSRPSFSRSSASRAPTSSRRSTGDQEGVAATGSLAAAVDQDHIVSDRTHDDPRRVSPTCRTHCC